jgi:raffinose/stachyose/melibiose transport system substrate-binding protein
MKGTYLSSVAIASLVAAGVTGLTSTRQAMADDLGSDYDVSTAGEQTLTLWWLGNQEVPGIEPWLAESVEAYQKLHPNITVETVVQAVDTYNTQQKTACKAGSGPDIWYNWGGTWSLELAWQGCLVPNEEVFSAEDLQGVPSIEGTRWGGKTWIHPFEMRIFPVVYNKDLFKQAGLDPENPPKTWDEFIDACKKLKEAGITPIVLGLKDGFGGEISGVGLQSQVFTIPELIQMVIDGDFTGKKWKSWLEKLEELKPYYNNDTNSILLADGLAQFQDGQAAMVFASPGYLQMIAAMYEAGMNPGVMKVPSFNDHGRGDHLTVDTPGFQVTSFATNKELAGNFLAFLHTQERLDALYEGSGTLPIDTRWDISKAKRATDMQLAAWAHEGLTYYSANFYPIDLDVNGNFVAFQGMLGGDMTVDQAAETYQGVITKWRSVHAEDIENYRAWLKDYQ